MILAVIVYAAVAIAAGAIEHGEGSGAYEAGRAVGAGLAGLIIGAIGRLVYVRFTPWGRGKPEVTPALFYLAAGIAAISILGRVATEESTAERYAADADACVSSVPDPFANRPSGVSLAELPAAGRLQLDAALATLEESSGLSTDRVEANTLVTENRPLGYVIAVPGLPEEEREGFQAGFTDGLGAQGGNG